MSDAVQPEPVPVPPELEERFEAPRTPVEAALAGIWSEVFGRERVGIHDDFFELGGHSLLATQVISRVQRTFDVELPLRRLFEEPTVARLAAAVRRTWASRTARHVGWKRALPRASPLLRWHSTVDCRRDAVN